MNIFETARSLSLPYWKAILFKFYACNQYVSWWCYTVSRKWWSGTEDRYCFNIANMPADYWPNFVNYAFQSDMFRRWLLNQI